MYAHVHMNVQKRATVYIPLDSVSFGRILYVRTICRNEDSLLEEGTNGMHKRNSNHLLTFSTEIIYGLC